MRSCLAWLPLASVLLAAAPMPADGASKKTLRVAGAQIPVTTNVLANQEAILRAIDFAAREKAQVLVTPEGSLSGYTHRFDPAATAQAMEVVLRRARDARVALVLGTCFATDEGQRYDAQRFYDDEGQFLGFHAKILLCQHIPEPGRPGENSRFQTAPLRTFALAGIPIGGLVCNDMWANPEWTPMPDPFLARQLAAQGARVVFVSVNSGVGEGPDLALLRAFHESNLQIRARTSRLWFVVANAADPAARLEVTCSSGVVSPDGRWTTRAQPVGEQFFVETISLP